MGTVNRRTGDDRTVLEHVLKVHKIAVVHALGIIVHVVEMDYAIFMGLDDLLRKEDSPCDVLGDRTCHVVALNGVDGGVFVGVLLLRLFVRAVDERKDLAVGRILLALQILDETVLDVVLGDSMGAGLLDLRLDNVLHLLDGKRTVMRRSKSLNLLRNLLNTRLGQLVGCLNRIVRLADGIRYFAAVESLFFATALDDVHCLVPLKALDILKLTGEENLHLSVKDTTTPFLTQAKKDKRYQHIVFPQTRHHNILCFCQFQLIS